MELGSAKSNCDICDFCICSVLYLRQVALVTRSKNVNYRACGEVGQVCV